MMCCEFKSAESLVSCGKHVSDATAARKPQVAGSNPAIDHIVLPLPRYSITRFHFLTAKIRVF